MMERGWIRRVRLRRVRIPLSTCYVSSMYVMDATHRTVVELEADDGSTGLGETLGTEDVFRLTASLAKRWIGASALDRSARRSAFARSVFDNRNGRNGWSAFAGLELAAWDLAGRILSLGVSELLGGRGRASVAVVSPIPAVVLEGPVDRLAADRAMRDLGNVAQVVEWARRWRVATGFGGFKYKSAGFSFAWDLAVMRALRDALGPDVLLRFDPNGAYPPAQAIALAAELDELGLELLEDPTDDLEGLAALRRRVRTPVATNMFVVQVDHLPAAIRAEAVDVVLGDAFMWGGLGGLVDAAAVARGFGIDFGVHSLFETGVATAAHLHFASALGLTRPSDSGLHLLATDVVAGGLGPVRDGARAVPEGVGLGVELDEAAMRELSIQETVVE